MTAALVRWLPCDSAQVLQADACERIVEAAMQAIASRGVFRVVLAGGQTPRAVYQLLLTADTDWSRWQLYFGDERCLPADNPERNSVMAAEALLSSVPLSAEQVHCMPAELGAVVAARAYTECLVGVDLFDLVLLGLGEDGHTASLFPNDPAGLAPDVADAVAVFNAPKPPAERVTLSADRLSRSRAVLFLVSGESKRDALGRWRAGDALPVQHINPSAGIDVLFERALVK